jgi:hypothetical protein
MASYETFLRFQELGTIYFVKSVSAEIFVNELFIARGIVIVQGPRKEGFYYWVPFLVFNVQFYKGSIANNTEIV